MTMFRQGDVLIALRSDLPDRPMIPIERVGERIILAYGEATGHAHAVMAPEAQLLTDGSADYLDVRGDSVDLVHEEHATITIPRGLYEVIRQREFTYEGGGTRTVLD